MASSAATARLAGVKAFLVDLDGTTYIDSELSVGASRFFKLLGARKTPHVFLSNNSSKSGRTYVDRLTKLGIPATRKQVLTSGDATIEYLARRTDHKSVCLIATAELEEDFRSAGFDTAAADPDCVVVAFDLGLTSDKLERACTLLFAGKPYFATHPDKTCITARGLIPDIAFVIAGAEAVTGRRPLIIGKPEAPIVEMALELLGTTAAETAIVGDQLDTDMVMGRQSGLLSCLVMTGETSAARLEAMPPAERPDLVFANIGELADAIA